MVKRKYATISDPKVYRRRTSPDDLERMVAELKGYRTAEVLFRGGEGGVEDSTKKVQEWLKGYPEKSFLGLITNGAVEALADGVNKGQEEEVCEAVWVPLLSLTHLAGDEGYSVCPCLTRYTQAACILLKNTLSFGAIESILPALTVLAQNGTACDYSLAMSSVRTLVVHHLKTGVPNPHMAPLLAHPFTSAPTTDKQQLHEICKTLVAAAVPSQSLVLFLREILGTQAIIDVEGLPCKRGVLGAYTLSLLLLDSDKVAFLADVIAVLPNPEKLVGHLLDKMKAKGVKRHVIDCLKGVLSAPGLTDGMVDIIGTILTENLKEADLLVAAKAFAGVRVLLEVHGEAWHDGAAIAGVMDASFKTLLSTSARLRSASGKTLLLLFRKMPHLAPHDASILIQQALVFLSSLPKPTDLDTNLVETLADVLALPQVSGSLSLVMTIPYDVVKAKYIAKKHRNVESMLSELPDTLWGEAAKYVPQEAYPADTTNANLLWFRAAAEPLIANVDEAVRNVFEGNRLLEARSALKLAAKNHLQWPYKHQFLSYCLQAHPLETLQYIDTLPGTDAREVAYPLLIDLEKRKMYRKLIELLTATVVICKEKWFETAEGKWVTVQDKVEDIEKEEGDPQDEQDNYLKDDQLKREKQGYVKRFAQLAFQNGILSRYATFVSRNIADGGAAECAVQVVKIAPGAVIDQMGHAAVSSLTPITVKVLAECIRNGFPGVKLLSSVLSDPDAEGSLKVSVAEELGGFLLSGQVRDSVDLLVTMSLCVGSLDAKLSGCAIKYIRCHVKSDPHPGQAVVNLFTSLPEKTNVGVALAILAGCPQVASAASSPFVNLLTDSLKAAAEGTPLDTRALDVAEVLAALSHTGHSLGVLYTYLKPLVPEGQDEDHKLPQALIASLLKLVQKQGNEKSGKGNALAELLKQASGKTSGYRKRSHTETKARTNALKEYEIAVASLAKIKKLAEKPLQVFTL